MSCAATDRTETCGRLVFNPATGALEIARAYRDKAAKAVMRDLRRTKLRVYFVFARLNRLKFALQSRRAVLLHGGKREGMRRHDESRSTRDFEIAASLPAMRLRSNRARAGGANVHGIAV